MSRGAPKVTNVFVCCCSNRPIRRLRDSKLLQIFSTYKGIVIKRDARKKCYSTVHLKESQMKEAGQCAWPSLLSIHRLSVVRPAVSLSVCRHPPPPPPALHRPSQKVGDHDPRSSIINRCGWELEKQPSTVARSLVLSNCLSALSRA